MYIYVYIDIHIYIYTCIYATYIYINVSVNLCIFMCVHTHTGSLPLSLSSCVHTHTQTYTHTPQTYTVDLLAMQQLQKEKALHAKGWRLVQVVIAPNQRWISPRPPLKTIVGLDAAFDTAFSSHSNITAAATTQIIQVKQVRSSGSCCCTGMVPGCLLRLREATRHP